MRATLWLLLLTSCLGWLLAAAPEAAAASTSVIDVQSSVIDVQSSVIDVQSSVIDVQSTVAPLVLDAGAPSEQNLCDAAVIAAGSAGAGAGVECQSGADHELEAVEQQRLADAARAALSASDDGEAPMCDESAASVGAQPFIPEVDRGHFEALPCEALWALLAHSLPKGERLDHRSRALAQRGDPQPPLERNQLSPERAHVVRAVVPSLPARGESCLLAREPQVGLGACSGHARNVYRPPRHH